MDVSTKETNILISSIDIVTNVTNVETLSNVQILTSFIVTKPTKLTGKCIATTPCILEVEISQKISIENLQLYYQ